MDAENYMRNNIYAYLFALLLVAGCSKRFDDLPVFSALPILEYENSSVGRFKTSYLADQIHAYFRGNASAPLAVATFVDLDNLYNSSTFGRLLGEQLMSELAMKGYNVLEVRQSDALQIMMEQGEFGLSRDVKRMRPHQDVSGLIVGTYTASLDRIYVNARLIDPANALVLSAGSVEMRRTDEISRMLRTNSLPNSLERIPVKNLVFSDSPAPYYFPYPPPTRFGQRGKYFEDAEEMYPAEPKDNSLIPPKKEEKQEAPKAKLGS
jgi:TolB-like protein